MVGANDVAKGGAVTELWSGYSSTVGQPVRFGCPYHLAGLGGEFRWQYSFNHPVKEEAARLPNGLGHVNEHSSGKDGGDVTERVR